VIEHIEISGFKSLRKVSLDLGALNIFVGTNASGKTNFFDAIRLLQGIGYGYSVDEIFNGRPQSANSSRWEQIRGTSANAGFLFCLVREICGSLIRSNRAGKSGSRSRRTHCRMVGRRFLSQPVAFRTSLTYPANATPSGKI